MRYLFMILICCGCSGKENHSYRAMNMHACRGGAYGNAFNAALMGPNIACIWPDEYPGSDEAGAAYKESQVAAEDADCVGDEDY